MTCSILDWEWASKRPVLLETKPMSLQACSRVDPGPNLAAVWSASSPASGEELMTAVQNPSGKALMTLGFVSRSPLAYGPPPPRDIPTPLCPFTTSACGGEPYGIGIPTTAL